jgi:hypothetical protein
MSRNWRRVRREQQRERHCESESAQRQPETNVQRNDDRRWRGVRGRSEFVGSRQECDQFAGDGVEPTTQSRFAGQRGDQPGKPGRRQVTRHLCEIDRLLPQIETRPPERRNYAEQLSVPVLAYGCEEERVKFSPNARRQCGVSHVVTQFCLRPKPNGGWSPRVAVGMGWEN